LLSKASLSEIKKTIHPRLVVRVTLNGKVIDVELLYGILAFGFIYTSTAVIFGVLLTLGGHDLVTSFSASIACLTSFGPGLAKVGPMDNFNFFSDWQKLLLAIEMIMGRLEVLPFLSVVYLLLLRD